MSEELWSPTWFYCSHPQTHLHSTAVPCSFSSLTMYCSSLSWQFTHPLLLLLVLLHRKYVWKQALLQTSLLWHHKGTQCQLSRLVTTHPARCLFYLLKLPHAVMWKVKQSNRVSRELKPGILFAQLNLTTDFIVCLDFQFCFGVFRSIKVLQKWIMQCFTNGASHNTYRK